MQAFRGGITFRKCHEEDLRKRIPAEIGFFEIISENYLPSQGTRLRSVELLRRERPFHLHGVCLSIGSPDPLNFDYLRELKRLIVALDAPVVSDHLCWTGLGAHNLHDLLAMPFTEETLRHVSARIARVQDFLGVPLALENTAALFSFNGSTISEAEFLAELTRETGCKVILDINNLYLMSQNFGIDAERYLATIPGGAVQEVHLAGFENREGILFDTHSREVSAEVWRLYAHYLRQGGRAPCLVEWDEKIPPVDVVLGELEKAKEIWNACVRPDEANSRHAA